MMQATNVYSCIYLRAKVRSDLMSAMDIGTITKPDNNQKFLESLNDGK